MTITTKLCFGDIRDYIPREMLKGWIDVASNKIPIHIDSVETYGDRLGLDGHDIKLKVSGCNVITGDIILVNKFKLYVC